MLITEKLQKAIEESRFYYNEYSLSVTMTFGVCEYNPSLGMETCISLADRALYKGKTGGRNCVVAAPPGPSN